MKWNQIVAFTVIDDDANRTKRPNMVDKIDIYISIMISGPNDDERCSKLVWHANQVLHHFNQKQIKKLAISIIKWTKTKSATFDVSSRTNVGPLHSYSRNEQNFVRFREKKFPTTTTFKIESPVCLNFRDDAWPEVNTYIRATMKNLKVNTTKIYSLFPKNGERFRIRSPLSKRWRYFCCPTTMMETGGI